MISKKKKRSSRQVMLHRAKFGRGGHVQRQQVHQDYGGLSAMPFSLAMAALLGLGRQKKG